MAREAITVSQLNRYIKAVLSQDEHLKGICLKGELSNFTDHKKTGHFYFTIKDDQCSVRAVMFRGYASKVRFAPENGMNVVITGNVQVFERDGTYQVYCETMEPDGIGALYLAFEQLKEKLAKEGLFAAEHKKQLPTMPMKIGVLTAKTGAALQDIINILSRRYPIATLVLVPTLVQGENAPQSIIDSLRRIQEQDDIDVVILGRGGGSIEDLWAFNDENVAREIYQCRIPIISAVGHEIDYTIADFVADLRAPTPSAAAELVAPDLEIVQQGIDNTSNLMYNYTVRRLQEQYQSLKALAGRLKLMSPSLAIMNSRSTLEHLSKRFETAFSAQLAEKDKRLLKSVEVLEALSPLSVLTRGYSITFESGRILSTAAEAKPGMTIETKLADGSLISTVTEVALSATTGKDGALYKSANR